MIAEVLSIGDELTSGARLDTNSQWFSERLAELGFAVRYHTTVADDLGAIVEVLQTAFQRADLVVANGGLGPTADDLTREAIARATSTELVCSQRALATIRAKFQRRRQPMPVRNEVQALLPAGSRLVPNPHGTAPGIAMEIARAGGDPCHLFALPGVPSELTEMWDASVRGAIAGLLPTRRVIRQYRIKCFGAGESRIEEMLPDLVRRGRTPTVGITASQATITLRITASGATADECDRVMQPTIRTIRSCLGRLVFGDEEEELEHAVMRLLRRARVTLATAEWGTGGLISQWLTALPGDRVHGYLGGVVIGSDDALPVVLGLADKCMTHDGCVSPRVVEALATTCREESGADYALASGPLTEAADGDGPPPFYVALATTEGVSVEACHAGGHPAIARVRSAKQALNVVRLALLDKGL